MYRDNNFLANVPNIMENSPYIVVRLVKDGGIWKPCFVSNNISQLNYTTEDLTSGRIDWFNLIHADDRIMLNEQIFAYEASKVYSFKLHYRIVDKDGQIIPITEYRTVHPITPEGIHCYDAFIVSNAQEAINKLALDNNALEQAILSDIFISIQDASPEMAIQLMLSRTGQYLNVSRALLFKDSPDHTSCKIIHEWCNNDITSVMNLDTSINYEESMPDIYIALQDTGIILINSGEIPESCRIEFEEEGLQSSAIFSVYLNGEHYGFVCFDDCIIKRVWSEEITRFLKTISNIISNAIFRKYTDDKLENSSKTYESVLNNLDSYIFVTEWKTNIIIFANSAFKKSFDYDCIGKPLSDFLPMHTLALPESNMDITDNADYPELYCHSIKQWLAITQENIVWIDKSQVTLFTCYDITAKKNFSSMLEQRIDERTQELKLMAKKAQSAKEKAEDATRTKSYFLANMSHEIRTPMNSILGLSERLTESNLEGTHLEYAKNIHKSSTILLSIINDILDISKLEAHKVTLVNTHYSPTKCLEQIAALAYNMAEDKNLKFSLLISDDIPICLYGDDIRLRQILINLLSNAIKYTEKGSVQLSADVANDTVIFSVADTGIGLKEDDLERIFEAFTQADVQKHRAVQSTGLGLSISRKLSKLMNGSVSAQSNYGHGSVFTLTIPKILGDKANLPIDEDKQQLCLHSPTAKVLVVDDIDINLYVAEALLEVFDISISTAKSGAEAIDLVQKISFDVVFMDHMMPVMDGVETTKAIRKLGNKFIDLPIIALTANAMSESQVLFKEAGMNDFISKPIELAKLQTVLERWLPTSKIIWKQSKKSIK